MRDYLFIDSARYHDAVICGAIERHATMVEAMREIQAYLPWVSPELIRVRAYGKRRMMVKAGRIDVFHGIKRPTRVRL